MSKTERMELCRQQRRNATAAEAFLWDLVRDRRFLGYKFRRQHPLGNFVADFYCPETRLAIELDGAVHAIQVSRDRARDAVLRSRRVSVLRITNEELLTDPLAALSRIEEAVEMISRKVEGSTP